MPLESIQDALVPMKKSMGRGRERCFAQGFHSAANVTFHNCEAEKHVSVVPSTLHWTESST
jgi:hypothetical protein